MSSTVPEVQNYADDLQGIVEKLMSNGTNNLQVHHKYILPPHERPQMISDQVSCYSESIPVVDLKDLDGPNRSRVIQEIRRVCEEDGFFQIVNHGVPETVMKSMMAIAKEFFEMPVEDRACLYSEDRKQLVRVSTSFNFRKDTVLHWRDNLRHPCHPLEEVMASWPQKPAAYREIAGKYATEVRGLVVRLLAAISEALGLDSDYLNRVFGKHSQVMLTNYYPSCPDPDLTFGLPRHSDPGGITVLMQGDVNGLQVLKNGNWVAVEPLANAFVVNLADQLQVVSNGRFRSVEHRAVTNASTARISIPTFYGPSNDAFIAPAHVYQFLRSMALQTMPSLLPRPPWLTKSIQLCTEDISWKNSWQFSGAKDYRARLCWINSRSKIHRMVIVFRCMFPNGQRYTH